MTTPSPYSGDGLVRPVNAPAGQQVLPGVQPGVTGAVVLASYVIVFGGTTAGGTAPGVFVYQGSPGPGNPPVFSVSDATQDPYGNAIAAGIWAGQFGGTQAGLEVNGAAGQLVFPVGGTSPQASGGIVGVTSGAGGQAVQVFSAVDQAPNNDRVFIDLQDHIATGSSAAYFIAYQDTGGVSRAQVQGGAAGLALNAVSQLTAVLPGTGTSSANQAQPETWHTATLINTWAGSSGVGGLFYRKIAVGDSTTQVTEVIADIINTTATGNSVCFNLPAAYRPATNQNHPAGWNNPQLNNSATVPWVTVTPAGDIQVTGIQVANKEIFFHIFIPLGIL